MVTLNGASEVGTQRLHPQPGDEWQRWPTDKQVREELGVNPPQLQAYLRKGYLTRWKCEDDVCRFNPLEVELCKARLGQNMAADVAEQREANTELKDILRRATELLKQCHEHQEKMFSLIATPIEKGTAFTNKIIDQQNEALAKAMEQADTALQLREQLLSQAHERDLKSAKWAATQEHVSKGIDKLTELVSPFVGQIAANLGLKKHPIFELFESLDPQMLVALANTGMLNEFQIGKLRELMPDLPWPAPGAAAAAEHEPPKQEPPAHEPPKQEPPKRSDPPGITPDEPPPTKRSGPPPRRRRRTPTPTKEKRS
jgi:hypothetical protein